MPRRSASLLPRPPSRVERLYTPRAAGASGIPGIYLPESFTILQGMEIMGKVVASVWIPLLNALSFILFAVCPSMKLLDFRSVVSVHVKNH